MNGPTPPLGANAILWRSGEGELKAAFLREDLREIVLHEEPGEFDHVDGEFALWAYVDRARRRGRRTATVTELGIMEGARA